MFTAKLDTRTVELHLKTLGKKAIPIIKKELKPIADQAKAEVKALMPKRTGALQRSTIAKPIKSKRKYAVGFRIIGKLIKVKKKEPLRKRKRKKPPKETTYYLFAPNYGVRKGRGKQPAQNFISKGAANARGKLPETGGRIVDSLAAEFNKG